MHPEISYFPSAQFYSSRLGNGRNTIVAGTELRSSFQAQHQLFTVEPYRVFDISYGSHSHVKNSLMNQAEVDFIVNLCNFLFEGDKNALLSGNIGIVSPYRQQIAAIKSEMVNRFGYGVLDAVEISTVDGFQGREKDIIIMSCVRASSSTNKSDGIGFLNDVRRMNVGITRARACMFIVCDSDHLQKNEVWKNLIDNAKERKCYTRVQSPPPATRTFRPALPQLKPAPVVAPPPVEPKRAEPRKEVVKIAPVKRKLDQPRLEDTKRQKTEQRKTQMIDIPSSKFKK
jgi:senataxin